MSINTNPKKIDEVLTRGVEEVIDKNHLKKRLLSGQKLRVKFGIDPTSPDLHLGHSIPLRKLRQFQDIGHQIIFLIGDFTAMIGDPSGRAEVRKPLTRTEIKKNMRNYQKQAARILDIKKVEVRYNSEWYEKKGAAFLTDLTSRFTYARLIERDEFKRRIKKDIDITMLELIYPLLQGYDSVEVQADVEIGGSDQKFNLLMGRKVQKKYGRNKQDIIVLSLLLGTDSVRKMSKSYKNYIGLAETSEKTYGKIMSIPDTLIWHYFKLLTDVSIEEIERKKEKVYKLVLNPRDVKAKLAREIISLYHSRKTAEKAEKEFNRVFREKKIPSKTPVFIVPHKFYLLINLLTDLNLTKSKNEAKRLILQKAVKINGKIMKDWQEKIEIKDKMVIKVGKRRFVKINTK